MSIKTVSSNFPEVVKAVANLPRVPQGMEFWYNIPVEDMKENMFNMDAFFRVKDVLGG